MLKTSPQFPPPEGLSLSGGILVLPKETSLVLRYGGRINNNRLYDRPIALGLTNMAAVYKSTGFVADVVRCFDLRRIARIRQLQQLTHVTVDEQTPHIRGPHVFDHTRLMPHSLLGGTFGALICQFVLGSSEQETHMAILRELLHDKLTCAGGDSWRTLPNSIVTPSMRRLFDEDAQIPQIFEKHYKSWVKLRDKYGLPHDTPSRVAMSVGEEQGIDGELHTLIDTLSYLACDLERVLYWYQRHRLLLPPNLAHAVALATPEVFNIWQHLAVRDGHVVITNHELLRQFLALRIAMWGGLYNHPGHKVLEINASNVMYPYLISERLIKMSSLLDWSDRELFAHLAGIMEMPNTTTHLDAFGGMPSRRAYTTASDAAAAEQDAARRGDYTLVIDSATFPILKTKANSYRVEHGGQVKLFAEAYPVEAEALRVRAASFADDSRYHLAVVAEPRLSAPLKRAWHQARERWLK